MKVNYTRNVVSDNVLQRLVRAIKNSQEKDFNKSLNKANVELCSNGKVTGYSSSNGYTVQFSFGEKSSITNKSGVDISVGDTVRVYYEKNDMVGAYIGTKL